MTDSRGLTWTSRRVTNSWAQGRSEIFTATVPDGGWILESEWFAYGGTNMIVRYGRPPVAGNLLLVAVSNNSGLIVSDPPWPFTVPAGWTLIGVAQRAFSHLAMFGRIAAGNDPEVIFTTTGGPQVQAVSAEFSGQAAGWPLDASAVTSDAVNNAATPAGAADTTGGNLIVTVFWPGGGTNATAALAQTVRGSNGSIVPSRQWDNGAAPPATGAFTVWSWAVNDTQPGPSPVTVQTSSTNAFIGAVHRYAIATFAPAVAGPPPPTRHGIYVWVDDE